MRKVKPLRKKVNLYIGHNFASRQRETRVTNKLRNCTKNEKSKDYCKADLKQRVLFFITIFRLAIPAFFRFTDVTELM